MYTLKTVHFLSEWRKNNVYSMEQDMVYLLERKVCLQRDAADFEEPLKVVRSRSFGDLEPLFCFSMHAEKVSVDTTQFKVWRTQ